jgi:DNA replication protein DnaC
MIGDPGIGKSALAAAAVHYAIQQDFAVLTKEGSANCCQHDRV